MAKGRPEFYFDGTYYRKRIKLQNGAWKDIRGKTKEETRAKIQRAREAERFGLALDDNTTVAELAQRRPVCFPSGGLLQRNQPAHLSGPRYNESAGRQAGTLSTSNGTGRQPLFFHTTEDSKHSKADF